MTLEGTFSVEDMLTYQITVTVHLTGNYGDSALNRVCGSPPQIG